MTFSDALFFTGKCLTLGCQPQRSEEIRQVIRSGVVEWERVVWVSTSYLVFPSLYLNLKRAGLLSELPEDLVEYMEEFTSLNRDRNRLIVQQARELTALLNQNGLTLVFLKGTAHLLANFYDDLGERMLSDIDFLVSGKSEMIQVAEILKMNGYEVIWEMPFRGKIKHWHYPPIGKAGYFVSVEIHQRMVSHRIARYFNYDYIKNDLVALPIPEKAYTMSLQHQVIYHMLVMQMNDTGYRNGNISLRQSYDLLLLSEKANLLTIASDFGRYFNEFNACLAVSSSLMGAPPGLSYIETLQTSLVIKRLKFLIAYPKVIIGFRGFFAFFGLVLHYFKQVIKMTYQPNVRAAAMRHWKSVIGKFQTSKPK